MTSDTTQHRLKHTYNTYYYKSLKQNTTPPLKKRWLIKMSQNKTAWSSILSNDGTLLYTNSLDALHHLGSCSNCLKTYNINQHLDIECAGKTRSWFFPFCQTMERCWVRWRNRKWKVCREVWRPRTVSEIRLRPPTTTRCLRPVYCELLLMSYVVLKNRVTARLTLTQICLPVLFCGVSYGYLHYQWFLLRNSVSGFWCHRRNNLPLHVASAPSLADFQTTTRGDLSVFPFLPRHYHTTRVLLLPFITTVGHLWSLQWLTLFRPR